MVQAASMNTVTNALSMAIAAASTFQISSIKAAQKMQVSGMKLNQAMAKTAHKSLLNQETLGKIELAVTIVMAVTIVTMGLGAAVDGAGVLSEEGTTSKVLTKYLQPAIKWASAGSSFGTAGATIAEGVYQGKQGSIEGKITKEQADISALQTGTKRLTKAMSSAVQSEQSLATVSSEVISNTLAANTAR